MTDGTPSPLPGPNQRGTWTASHPRLVVGLFAGIIALAILAAAAYFIVKHVDNSHIVTQKCTITSEPTVQDARGSAYWDSESSCGSLIVETGNGVSSTTAPTLAGQLLTGRTLSLTLAGYAQLGRRQILAVSP